MATSNRGLRAFARWQIALAILFVVSFVAAVFVAGTPYPYRDDWDWLAWRFDGPVTLTRLLAPHNEHLPLLPRLISLLQFALEKSGNHVTRAISLASLLGAASLILNEARRHVWPSMAARALAIGVGATLLFFAWQLQSMLLSNAVGFPLVELFAIIAIVCVLNVTDASAHARRWTVAAFGAAILAMATTSAGLFVPIVAAALAWCRRARRSLVVSFVLLFAVGLALYFVLKPAPDPSVPAGSIGQAIALFFSFFASFAAYRWPALGVGVGAVMLAGGLAILWPVLRRSPGVARLEQVAAAIVMFTSLTAIAVASARAGFGPTQAAQSRYATFVLPFWCALWLVLWNRVSRANDSRVGSAVAALSVLATLALTPLHLLTMLVWQAKSANTSAAATAVVAGIEDDEWLHTLHPNSRVVIETTARLRAIGDPLWQLPTSNARAEEIRGLTPCSSGFLALPLTRSGDYELRSSLDTAGDRGLVLDERGSVIGVAHRAPLVASPEPSHSEVIAAVLRELRHKTPRQWLGFARAPAGLPASVVIEQGATLVCLGKISGS